MSGICSFFCLVQTSAKTGKVYSMEVGIPGHFTGIEARIKYRIASKVQIRYLSASDSGLLSFIQLKTCNLVHLHLKTDSVVRNLHLWKTTWERYRQPRNYHPPPELMPQKCLGNQVSGQLWVCWGMVSVPGRRGLCSDGRVLLLHGDTTCRVAVAVSSRMLSDSSELHRVQKIQVLSQFLWAPQTWDTAQVLGPSRGKILGILQLLVYQPLSQLV